MSLGKLDGIQIGNLELPNRCGSCKKKVTLGEKCASCRKAIYCNNYCLIKNQLIHQSVCKKTPSSEIQRVNRVAQPVTYASEVKSARSDYQPKNLSSHKKQLLSDGSFYEGSLRNDKPHGQGKLTQPNGNTYEGTFRNGLPHGKGKLTEPDGTLLYEGDYEDGEPYGPM